MKKLQNNFTTPEQSKLLLEIGVPADSADCYLLRTRTEGDTFIVKVLHDELYSRKDKFDKILEYLPCWSVGRLIEVLREVSNYEFGDFHTHLTNIIVSDDVVETLIRSIQWELPKYKRYQERQKEESKAATAPQKKSRVSHDVEVLSLASKTFGEISGNDDDYVGMHDFLY